MSEHRVFGAQRSVPQLGALAWSIPSACMPAAQVLRLILQVVQRDHGNLGRWLSRQKLLWRTGKLSESRVTQLRALGVDIDCMTDIAGNLLQTPE